MTPFAENLQIGGTISITWMFEQYMRGDVIHLDLGRATEATAVHTADFSLSQEVLTEVHPSPSGFFPHPRHVQDEPCLSGERSVVR